MNDAGAKLSHARKEIRDMEPILGYEDVICDKIKALQKLGTGLNGKNISTGRLFVHAFSEREIAHNIVVLQPMTPEIRRQLYQTVNSKKLFLKYRFEDISLSEAKAVIDYADGKSDVMPSCLLTPEEARNIALKRQAEASGYAQLDKDLNSSVRNSELDRQSIFFSVLLSGQINPTAPSCCLPEARQAQSEQRCCFPISLYRNP